VTTFSEQLHKGLFPRELPPTFSTLSLANAVQAFRQLPPAFIRPPTARLGSHNIARPGGLRRRLGMPNPVLHMGLCNEVASSWAEIARFYPSIYTHSIPWALHGKATAKATMGHSALLGDRLDRLMRKGQDNQAVGIPIGPDTSLVVAEILLSVIDQGL
jgi:hypothetical protein